MTSTVPGPAADPAPLETSLRTPVLWGLLFGVLQASSPLVFWWLEAATVHALMIALIAAVYVGFAVADGRPKVIAVEVAVVAVFYVVAAAAVTASVWLLVVGYAGHGLKDLWQEHRHFVSGTRWWPPFCAAVDFLVAAVLAVQILSGARFR
jgi:hypothetical protein